MTDPCGAHISNIESEMLASDRFQHVIKRGWFQEHEVNHLDMGEVGHEFQPNTHLAGEAKILQQDGHPSSSDSDEANSEDDLWVDLL